MLNRLHPASRTTALFALAALATILTGCQSIAGIQPVSQVRVIDASPDAPAIDFYQNSPQTAQSGLYNIGFGTVSSYIPMSPGSYTHAAYISGTQQQLASVRGIFSTGRQYTVLAGNVAANLQMTVLQDQSTPAPAGQIAVRFLDQTTRGHAVDIYLLPAGSSPGSIAPIATGISFGANTGYIDAPSGTYSIVAFPAGAAPALTAPIYTGSQVAYPAGSAHTIVLIDQPSIAASGLQIISAEDFDAAS
jgi:hypothetical protein